MGLTLVEAAVPADFIRHDTKTSEAFGWLLLTRGGYSWEYDGDTWFTPYSRQLPSWKWGNVIIQLLSTSKMFSLVLETRLVRTASSVCLENNRRVSDLWNGNSYFMVSVRNESMRRGAFGSALVVLQSLGITVAMSGLRRVCYGTVCSVGNSFSDCSNAGVTVSHMMNCRCGYILCTPWLHDCYALNLEEKR